MISSGLANADAVTVMIWFLAETEGKQYLPPKQYAALLPAEVDQYWTLAPQDRIVRGDVPDIPVSEVVAKYDDAITITSAEAMDYGNVQMRHWEVSGK